jgi:hypothetical protein
MKLINKLVNKIDEIKTKKYWKKNFQKILASFLKGVASSFEKKK